MDEPSAARGQRRSALALVAVTSISIACSPRLEVGAACEPGHGIVEIRHEIADHPECVRPAFHPLCSWVCSGPPGCEGEAGFTWSIEHLGGDASLVWCGCDGRTQGPLVRWGLEPVAPDAFTILPVDRFRWYGSCEEPCEDLFGFEYRGMPGFAINPACTECGEARWADGRCLHPSGFALPAACCECYRAALDGDGTCRDGRAPDALELAPACCDCGGAMLVEGRCLSPAGLELPSPCCDCTDAWLDPDESCRHVDGIELPAECCRCLDAHLAADGITCVREDADFNEVPAPPDCCALE